MYNIILNIIYVLMLLVYISLVHQDLFQLGNTLYVYSLLTGEVSIQINRSFSNLITQQIYLVLIHTIISFNII